MEGSARARVGAPQRGPRGAGARLPPTGSGAGVDDALRPRPRHAGRAPGCREQAPGRDCPDLRAAVARLRRGPAGLPPGRGAAGGPGHGERPALFRAVADGVHGRADAPGEPAALHGVAAHGDGPDAPVGRPPLAHHGRRRPPEGHQRRPGHPRRPAYATWRSDPEGRRETDMALASRQVRAALPAPTTWARSGRGAVPGLAPPTSRRLGNGNGSMAWPPRTRTRQRRRICAGADARFTPPRRAADHSARWFGRSHAAPVAKSRKADADASVAGRLGEGGTVAAIVVGASGLSQGGLATRLDRSVADLKRYLYKIQGGGGRA